MASRVVRSTRFLIQFLDIIFIELFYNCGFILGDYSLVVIKNKYSTAASFRPIPSVLSHQMHTTILANQ